jgi:thiol-disulfide isomerase/thioredoxin
LPSSCTTGKRFFAEVAGSLLALSLSSCERAPEDKPQPSAVSAAAPEKAAPAHARERELQSVSAEGLLAEVRRLGGKGTLVNAWASWCGPCKHEIPMLEQLSGSFEPRGVHVLLVSLDEPDDRPKAIGFLNERQVKLTSFLAERPLGAFKQGLNPRWPGMLPASFLFDASGTLRYYWGGEAFEQELTPVLEALASGRPIEGEADIKVAPEGETH